MKSGLFTDNSVLFLLAVLGFAKPNSPAKVHADTINDVVTSVNISKSTGGAITDPLGVWRVSLKQTLCCRMDAKGRSGTLSNLR